MGRTGPAGDFKRFQDARTAEIFNELAERPPLEGQEQVETEHALVDSFYLYFSEFGKGQLKAESLEYIEVAFGGETEFDVPINPYSVVFEFARQLVQLREANSITETTFAQFARQVLAWLNRALRVHESWRTRSIAKVASSTAPLSNPWFSKWRSRCARSMSV